MGYLFKYVDPDGYELSVAAGEDLRFRIGRADDVLRMPTAMNTRSVRELRDILSSWLNDKAADEPVYGADTLYGQLIQQAVAAEVARVLPLHQEMQAAAEDPEPHEVGHPVYEDARPKLRVGPSHCDECTHPMNDHIALGGCWGANGTCECGLLPKDPVPVAVAGRVWGEQGQPPSTSAPCSFCGHAQSRHPNGAEGTCTHRDCGCTEYTPSTS